MNLLWISDWYSPPVSRLTLIYRCLLCPPSRILVPLSVGFFSSGLYFFALLPLLPFRPPAAAVVSGDSTSTAEERDILEGRLFVSPRGGGPPSPPS